MRKKALAPARIANTELMRGRVGQGPSDDCRPRCSYGGFVVYGRKEGWGPNVTCVVNNMVLAGPGYTTVIVKYCSCTDSTLLYYEH